MILLLLLVDIGIIIYIFWVINILELIIYEYLWY